MLKEIMKNCLLALFLMQSVYFAQIPIEISPDKSFPLWLRVNDKFTDQTSGICFIEQTGDKKHFLIADDVGFIHHLIIINDEISEINTLAFNDKVEDYLKQFPKRDFEEISYDQSTGDIYLSIEGNFPDPQRFTKIVKVKFEDDSFYSGKIIDLEEVTFYPKDKFDKYLSNNAAYEGFAVDAKYYYLGLEGFSSGSFFADSTILFIADKKSKNIIKEISTKRYGIHTICGLQAVTDGLWGIDRNNAKIFFLIFDEQLDISQCLLFEFKSKIPGTDETQYVAAIESITTDNQNNLYIIDDPWKKFYIPPKKVLNKLSDESVENFNKFVPIIYKYNVIR